MQRFMLMCRALNYFSNKYLVSFFTSMALMLLKTLCEWRLLSILNVKMNLCSDTCEHSTRGSDNIWRLRLDLILGQSFRSTSCSVLHLHFAVGMLLNCPLILFCRCYKGTPTAMIDRKAVRDDQIGTSDNIMGSCYA